jgi:phage terminase small subunit
VALTPQQERFCREYLADLNATAAYRRAYPKAKPHSAHGNANRLMANEGVRDRIVVLQAERAIRSELTADWVVERLRMEATRFGEGSTHAARVQALHLLGRHLGMFVDRLRIETGTLPDVSAISDADRADLLRCLRPAFAPEMVAGAGEGGRGGAEAAGLEPAVPTDPDAG